jgi:hypothetical protein
MVAKCREKMRLDDKLLNLESSFRELLENSFHINYLNYWFRKSLIELLELLLVVLMNNHDGTVHTNISRFRVSRRPWPFAVIGAARHDSCFRSVDWARWWKDHAADRSGTLWLRCPSVICASDVALRPSPESALFNAIAPRLRPLTTSQ